MATRVAINGFGKVGGLQLGVMLEGNKRDFSVVTVNDTADPRENANLFRYDSTSGSYPGKVENRGGCHKNSRPKDYRTGAKKEALVFPGDNPGGDIRWAQGDSCFLP
jgi:glyceraldehyde-3-phosphate dehydrogenase/erythrose-4-phosphate dehydrogenase